MIKPDQNSSDQSRSSSIVQGAAKKAKEAFLAEMERNEATKIWASARMFVLLDSIQDIESVIEVGLIDLETGNTYPDWLADEVKSLIDLIQEQYSVLDSVVGEKGRWPLSVSKWRNRIDKILKKYS